MQNILVTGGASGIGHAIAVLFHQRGWHVGLLDHNEAGLKAIAQTLGGDLWYQAVDVTDAAAVAQAVAAFAARHDGKLRLLVNSAGLLYSGRFEEISTDQHRQLVSVNVQGMINCCHGAFAFLRDTQQAQIINLSSVSSLYGTPFFASYSASKFAVRGLTEALNIEWAPCGIHVCDLAPAFTATPMVAQQAQVTRIQERLGVTLLPEDVAKAAWKVSKRRRGRHVVLGLPFPLKQLEGLTPQRVRRLLLSLLSKSEH